MKKILEDIKSHLAPNECFFCHIMDYRMHLTSCHEEVLDYLKPIALELGMSEDITDGAWCHGDMGINNDDEKYYQWKLDIINKALEDCED
jgi:predicted transport protein